MERHRIIIATIRDGNVQKISRHMVTTVHGAARLGSTNNTQIWMTRETAAALNITNAVADEIFGGYPKLQMKTQSVMDEA